MATIKDIFGSATAMTITLASLATSAVGVGRQSTLVDNTTNAYLSADIYVKVTTGTTPTINTPIYVYLIRYDNSAIADDAAGTTDAGFTVIIAPLLGVINVNSATSNVAYLGVFDTSPFGSLGPKWGIAIVNNTGAALNATPANHVVNFIGVTKSVV